MSVQTVQSFIQCLLENENMLIFRWVSDTQQHIQQKVLWGLKSLSVLKTRYIISPSPAACIFKPLPPDRVSARLQFHTSVSATSERPLSWTSDKRARKRRDRTVLTRLLKELSQGSISGRTEWPHHMCESSRSLRRAWRGCTWTSCPKHEKSKQTNYPSGGQW